MQGAIVLTVCGLATAYLITNCPKGGKRSRSAVDVLGRGGGEISTCPTYSHSLVTAMDLRMQGAIMLTVCGLATACLITNCPKGGKRSRSAVDALGPDSQQCLRCGPGQQGRCLGPAVCCGPSLGCLVATPGILGQCVGSAGGPSPRGKPCITPSGIGVCATDGVCCNSESCQIDLSCEMEPFADICAPDEPMQDNQF